MGRFLTLLTLLILGTVAVRTQEPKPFLTREKFNGVAWRTFSDMEKSYYIRGTADGLFQGVMWILTPLKGGPCNAGVGVPKWWINSDTTTGDHVKDMDGFYEDGANSSVPIIDAYVYSGMKLGGATKAELDSFLKSVK